MSKKEQCTKMMHLPVSKVFISTRGYRWSRKEGKRIRTVTFRIL